MCMHQRDGTTRKDDALVSLGHIHPQTRRLLASLSLAFFGLHSKSVGRTAEGTHVRQNLSRLEKLCGLSRQHSDDGVVWWVGVGCIYLEAD